MIETRDKIIDGATYTVTQLPARRALRLKARLVKTFGPTLAQVFVSASKDKGDNSDLVRTIELLGASLDENTFESLVGELLTGVRKNGVELTPQIIDLEFAGDMPALYQVLWFVVEVNFGNFFSFLGIGSQFVEEAAKMTADTKKTFTRTCEKS